MIKSFKFKPAFAADEPDDSRQVLIELATCLGPMVDQLPEDYRQAIRLTDLGELTQAEMATALGLSASGARSRVQRARARLRVMLQECCHFQLDRSGRVLDYHPRSPGCPACAGQVGVVA